MSVEVVYNAGGDRYEIREDGKRVGFADARRRGGLVSMSHVEIDPARQGRNLANQLVREALDDIRARGERVVPLCPFVVAFLRRNTAYQDLIA